MDFTASNHGSIVILYALTPAAKAWADEHLAGDVQLWGPAGYVVEPRYIVPIIEGAIADGLSVAQNTRVSS